MTSFGDLADEATRSRCSIVPERLATLDLAFIHVIEGETGGDRAPQPFNYAAMRGPFKGTWIVNNGYDRAMAIDAMASGKADLVAFGRPFISNPDLPRRLREQRR